MLGVDVGVGVDGGGGVGGGGGRSNHFGAEQIWQGRACLDACAACARLGDAEGLKSWAQRAKRHYADAVGQ